MIGAFSFNGVESDNFKLVCKSVKRPLLPSAKMRRVELAGTSGSYDFDGVEYENRELTMKIVYLGANFQELRSRARLIAAWLSTGSWAQLIINDEPDKYYLAKVTNEIDLQSIFEAGEAEITFDCQPFAMSVVEQSISFGATGGSFVNAGTREINYRSPQGAKFLIILNGSWSSLVITMNGLSLNYTQAGNGTLVIDNVNMECKLSGVNKFSALNGAIDTFFSVPAGNNILTVTGLTGSVAVNYIPMWL